MNRIAIPAKPNQGLLVQADNLKLMALLDDGCCDLIITDPPFYTGRRQEGGRNKTGQALSYDDLWEDHDQYIAFMQTRLIEAHRLLSPTGTVIVHLDYRAVHEIKIELDRIFGRERFINEIIWHYTGGGRAKRYFSRKHDTLLWYGKGESWTFNIDEVRVPYKETSGFARGGIVGQSGKRYYPHPDGTPVDDVWDIPMVNPLSRERCGYPSQKPLRLLERLVLALSNEGDLIFDPFCGSGTTAIAAAGKGRRWIGCDESPDAVEATKSRLEAMGHHPTCVILEKS
jgi:site-specific DNA-methyltransferase (adenine-specific)